MTNKLFAAGAGSVALLFSVSALSQQSAPAADELETVLITAQRADRVSRGATGLNLDIKDTPQSISVVTSEQMDQFGTNDINDALRLATGISVEEWETNRTNYLARGFEIKNTQLDGVGLPNNWGIVTGAFDTFGYDKLEVIRGANGLLTGVGNASGTINYVRKRPTNDVQGEIGLTGSSWGGKRVEADYSTPLTDSGTWAARVIGVYDDQNSWLRSLENDRVFLSGVVDGQLGDRSTIALGFAWQEAHTTGNMWGALTLSNSDGTQAEFPRNSSTTQDWTFWNTRYQNAFAEYTFALSDDWNLKATYNYRRTSENDTLFYASTLGGLDPVTAEGLIGYPGRFMGNEHANLGDVQLTGRFSAWGLEHQLLFGLSQASSTAGLDNFEVSPLEPAFGELPAFPYPGNAVPEPVWGAVNSDDHNGQKMRRAYGAAQVGITARFKAVVGFNHSDFDRQGVNSFGVYYEQGESQLSPYAGLTFDITDRLLAYASYSDIYQPQDQTDINEIYLDPTKGVNYEVGLKAGWLDNRLLTTLAWFSAKQENLATFAGLNSNSQYYYEGVDVDSTGFELEVTGRVNEYVNLVVGVTTLDLEGEDGADIYEWVPRETVNFNVVSKIPGFIALQLGIGGKWQSDVSKVDSSSGGTVSQDGYLTANVFGAWKINPQLTARLNVNNVTDEKYISSLYEIGYYGAPRNYALSVDYRF